MYIIPEKYFLLPELVSNSSQYSLIMFRNAARQSIHSKSLRLVILPTQYGYLLILTWLFTSPFKCAIVLGFRPQCKSNSRHALAFFICWGSQGSPQSSWLQYCFSGFFPFLLTCQRLILFTCSDPGHKPRCPFSVALKVPSMIT